MPLEWSELGGEEWEVKSQREQGVQAQNLGFVLSENPTCSPGISWLCFRVGTCLPLFSLSLTNQEPPRAGVGALILGPPDVERTLSKYLASSSWLPPPKMSLSMGTHDILVSTTGVPHPSLALG